MTKLYCITHRASGKMYIDVTNRDMDERWRDHVADAARYRYKFANAIRKHGSRAFDIEVLHNYDTREEALEAEIALIDALDNCASGYNTSRGGDAPPPCIARSPLSGRAVSPEVRTMILRFEANRTGRKVIKCADGYERLSAVKHVTGSHRTETVDDFGFDVV